MEGASWGDVPGEGFIYTSAGGVLSGFTAYVLCTEIIVIKAKLKVNNIGNFLISQLLLYYSMKHLRQKFFIYKAYLFYLKKQVFYTANKDTQLVQRRCTS